MQLPLKECNFLPFGLHFPSPKLHHDAKKKNATFGQNRKCRKKLQKKMQVAFSPLPCNMGALVGWCSGNVRRRKRRGFHTSRWDLAQVPAISRAVLFGGGALAAISSCKMLRRIEKTKSTKESFLTSQRLCG